MVGGYLYEALEHTWTSPGYERPPQKIHMSAHPNNCSFKVLALGSLDEER